MLSVLIGPLPHTCLVSRYAEDQVDADSLSDTKGANVFVRSFTMCRMQEHDSRNCFFVSLDHLSLLPASVPFCLSAFEGGSWQLVRRVKQGATWHPANDNLNGTASYGSYGGPTFDSSFSVPFATWLRNTTEMLFITGMVRRVRVALL